MLKRSVTVMLAYVFLAGASSTPPTQAPSPAPLHGELIERLLVSLSAEQVLTAMRLGILTSEQYVTVLLDRIARHPEVNAFIYLDPDQALAAARASDEQRAAGGPLGRLHGLPILLKDNINTADFPTSAGTPALVAHQPAVNAPVAQRLIDAGAIILGKTNMHELALGITGQNAFFGAPRNPHDLDYMTGGSSSGNGAAMAARFAPLSIGSDTGGSVRIPAALTGTMGFRPSSGRYPQEGIVPISATLDTAGPMGRHVGDLALVDAILTGTEPGLERVRVRGLRIGIPHANFRENLDPEVAEALGRVFRRLEWAGAKLVDVDIPGVPVPSLDVNLATGGFEWPRDLSAYLLAEGTGLDFETLAPTIASPDVAGLAQLLLANPVPEAVYDQLLQVVRPGLQASYREYLAANDLDVVLYPTTPAPAGRLDEVDPAAAFPVFTQNAHFTPVVGAPTLTLPIGLTEGGLPLGIDLAGAIGDDRRLLAIGQAIDRILPRVPPPAAIQPAPFPPS